MGRVVVTVPVEGPVGEAEALWYDLDRWPAFVDGFGHVELLEGGWPAAGGRVEWSSRRGGRGRVIEEVDWQAPGAGQDVVVEDDRLTGLQRVRFGEGAVSLELEYELKRSLWLVDVLYVRRALRDALRRTLERFATELRGDRDLRRTAS